MLEQIWQDLIALPTYLIDANKRIYLPYLLSAAVMAYLVFRVSASNKTAKGFLLFLFPKKVWLCKSAKLDYTLLITNKIIKAASFTPIVLTMVPVALATTDFLEWLFGAPLLLNLPAAAVITFFTVLLFLLDDVTRYILHLLLHKVPFLWEFHKVHHSAKVLTPFTIYRTHPVESYLYACRMALTQGVAVGIGYHLFGTTLSMYDILGANVFVFLFNILGANLRHSHIWFSWGDKLENWFISPAQHQVHHSDNPAHFDTNLGAALAIWDRIGGSLIKASEAGKVTIGVGKYDARHDSLMAIYWLPLKLAFRSVMQSAGKSKKLDKQIRD